MSPLVVVGARLAQFLAATILFGAPLFFVYGMARHAIGEGPGWRRPLLGWAAVALAIGALISLAAQTATMTDDPTAAFDPGSVWTVFSGTQFGSAIAVRMICAVIALRLALLTRPSRQLWIAAAAIGAIAMASFAWTGHGAADDGTAGLVHLVADVLHLLAAGVWLGALAVLAILLVGASDPEVLRRGLEGFSGIGAAVVATLVLTGLVNSWFLVGPAHVGALVGSAYGLALIAKVAMFVGMLGLAALNRFSLTPRLAMGGDPALAIRALRTSVLLETGVAVVVMVLVSLLGTLEPPSALG